LQWLQDPSEINRDNLNKVRHEASKPLINKKREYLKGKINHLVTKSETKNIRGLRKRMNELNRGYQPRNNLVKDENGNLPANSQKGDKTDCNNCGISLLSTSYKILSDVLPSSFSTFIDEIIGDHQCGF
jgi:hypothetical protein